MQLKLSAQVKESQQNSETEIITFTFKLGPFKMKFVLPVPDERSDMVPVYVHCSLNDEGMLMPTMQERANGNRIARTVAPSEPTQTTDRDNG